MESRKPYNLKTIIAAYNIFQVIACSYLVYNVSSQFHSFQDQSFSILFFDSLWALDSDSALLEIVRPEDRAPSTSMEWMQWNTVGCPCASGLWSLWKQFSLCWGRSSPKYHSYMSIITLQRIWSFGTASNIVCVSTETKLHTWLPESP